MAGTTPTTPDIAHVTPTETLAGVPVYRTVEQVRAARRAVRGSLALTPTMGALHDGHLDLVRAAATEADQVWVSIFVNPTQFGPNEDFARYPRDLEADVEACASAGADAIFAPEPATMYPPGQVACVIDAPLLTDDLEGAQRPGHFQGVCRVVAKLLNLTQPDVAVFGRKDYQQWRVIEALVADLMMPTRIVARPTVREPDGLAMSSRNRYLDADARQRGLGISRALAAAVGLIEKGVTDVVKLEAVMRDVLEQADLRIDYAAVRDADTLAPITQVTPGAAVALIAARVSVGDHVVRLIDNRAL